jgi:hypothetical protein
MRGFAGWWLALSLAFSLLVIFPNLAFAQGVPQLRNDLGGTPPAPEVVGELNHPFPALTSGYQHWTGSAWAFDTPSISGSVTGTGFWYSVSGVLQSAAIVLGGDVSQGALSAGVVPLDVNRLQSFSGPLTAPENGSWAVTSWYVDPLSHVATCSDTNAGTTSAAPLCTFAEIARRWGTLSPVLASATTIYLESNDSSSDPFSPAPVAGGGSLTITGVLSSAQQVWSTTVSSYAARAYGTHASPGTLTSVSAPGSASAPSGYSAQLVYDSTHPSYAWVYGVSGGTMTLSQPLNGTTEVSTWANGDTITGYAPPTAYIPSYSNTTLTLLTDPVPNIVADQITHASLCSFNAIEVSGAQYYRVTTFTNDYAPNLIYQAGFTAYPNFPQAPIAVNGGEYYQIIGSVGLTDDVATLPGTQFQFSYLANSAIGAGGTTGGVYIGNTLQLQGESDVFGPIWGPSGVIVYSGSLSLASSASTYLFFGGTISGGGITTGCVQSSAGQTCGITLSAANLDLAVASGGFGGYAIIQGNGVIRTSTGMPSGFTAGVGTGSVSNTGLWTSTSGTLNSAALNGVSGTLLVGQGTSTLPSFVSPSGAWTINSSGVATLATVNSNVGTWGSATAVATPVVNAQGLITAISNTPIAIPLSQLTQSGATTNQVATWNGSTWAAATDPATVTWANDLTGSSSTNQYVAAISGNAGAGGNVPVNATLQISPSGTTVGYIGVLSGFPTYLAIYGNVTPSSSNYAFTTGSAGTYVNAPSGGVVGFDVAGSQYGSLSTTSFTINPAVTFNNLSGSGTRFVTASSTGLLGASALSLSGLPAPTGTGVALVSSGSWASAAGTVNLTSSTYVSGLTQYDVLVGGTSGVIGQIAPSSTTGYVLVSNGTSANVGFSAATAITSVGTLTGGTLSTGVTIQASNVTWTGSVPAAQLPTITLTGDAAGSGSGGSIADTISQISGAATIPFKQGSTTTAGIGEMPGFTTASGLWLFGSGGGTPSSSNYVIASSGSGTTNFAGPTGIDLIAGGTIYATLTSSSFTVTPAVTLSNLASGNALVLASSTGLLSALANPASCGSLPIGQGTGSNPAWHAPSGDVSMTCSGGFEVVGLSGHAVSSSAPSTGQALVWNGSDWTPTTQPKWHVNTYCSSGCTGSSGSTYTPTTTTIYVAGVGGGGGGGGGGYGGNTCGTATNGAGGGGGGGGGLWSGSWLTVSSGTAITVTDGSGGTGGGGGTSGSPIGSAGNAGTTSTLVQSSTTIASWTPGTGGTGGLQANTNQGGLYVASGGMPVTLGISSGSTATFLFTSNLPSGPGWGGNGGMYNGTDGIQNEAFPGAAGASLFSGTSSAGGATQSDGSPGGVSCPGGYASGGGGGSPVGAGGRGGGGGGASSTAGGAVGGVGLNGSGFGSGGGGGGGGGANTVGGTGGTGGAGANGASGYVVISEWYRRDPENDTGFTRRGKPIYVGQYLKLAANF